MAPVLPVMIVFSVLSLFRFLDLIIAFVNSKFKVQSAKFNLRIHNFLILICHFSFYSLIFALTLPGIAYLHIYQAPDARVQASKWIYSHIPAGSNILFETANVVDIPVQSSKLLTTPRLRGTSKAQNYQTTSFDFYALDSDNALAGELKKHIEDADYIFVPSSRIFANHTCLNPDGRLGIFSILNGYSKSRCDRLEKEYPRLNEYYRKLFSGDLGFVQVAEFTSYPTINFLNNKLFEQKDERSEETWTVFDHPVIRIYKRV